MGKDKSQKIERVLSIYADLLHGRVVNKAEVALKYGVNERSIQRDIDDIRTFMETDYSNGGIRNSVLYDRIRKGYCLETTYLPKLSNSEVLAICKILLDSRAFTKVEMNEMLKKLIDCCVPKENQDMVNELIRNEAFHYIEPRHKTVFIDCMWSIGQAIQKRRFIEVKYQRLRDKAVKTRRLMPLAIMFSEYYFYLVAFIDDEALREHFDVFNESFPTIYRIDRIHDLKVLDEHYHTPYKGRFEEGEFRKRIQFMYGGKLRKIKFLYKGLSIEAVLDRLPTAVYTDNGDGTYTVEAEVFGDGVDMWLKGQGESVEVV